MFEMAFAKIFNVCIEQGCKLVAQIGCHHCLTRAGQRTDARGQVDIGAVNVIFIGYKSGQMAAYAEMHLLFGAEALVGLLAEMVEREGRFHAALRVSKFKHQAIT